MVSTPTGRRPGTRYHIRGNLPADPAKQPVSAGLLRQYGKPVVVPGGKYYPDFIALDIDGTYWLIEGKSDDSAQRQDVQAKKAAAEEWARFVNDDGRFHTWRYLFCTETVIKNSRGGWDGLLAASAKTT